MNATMIKTVAVFTALVVFVAAEASPADLLVLSMRLDDVSLSDFTKMLRTQYRVNSVLEDSSVELARLDHINLDLKYVPLWVAVKYAAREAGVRYQFRDGMLFLGRNLKIVEPYYPVEYKLRHSALDKYADGTRMSVEESAYYPIGYKPGKTIVVGNTVVTMPPIPIFRKFYSGFWYDSMPSQTQTEAENIAANRAKRHPYKIPEDFPLTKAKLYEIKVDVDFKKTPLREALRTLRELAVEHDPHGQGVNFYLAKNTADREFIINMKLAQITLYQAISYICQAAGLEFRVAPCVVEIYEPE